MTYQIVKIFHILSVVGLLGPLILTPKWLHLYRDGEGRKILKDLHRLTGVSGWMVLASGVSLLWFQHFAMFSFPWMKISIFLFLAIQVFDHFWADKMEEKLETDLNLSGNKLKLWLVIKILLYILLTSLMVLK